MDKAVKEGDTVEEEEEGVFDKMKRLSVSVSMDMPSMGTGTELTDLEQPQQAPSRKTPVNIDPPVSPRGPMKPKGSKSPRSRIPEGYEATRKKSKEFAPLI